MEQDRAQVFHYHFDIAKSRPQHEQEESQWQFPQSLQTDLKPEQQHMFFKNTHAIPYTHTIHTVADGKQHHICNQLLR